MPIAKVLFQSHAMERGGARQHGGGATSNNGYSCGQSSLSLLTERVDNGYYSTVVCLIDAYSVAIVLELSV